MRNRAPANSYMRSAVAFIVLVAAVVWANLSPLHAGGPGVLRAAQTAATMPCHHQAEVRAESGSDAETEACAALCAIAAPVHYIGQAVLPFSLDGAKAAVPSATAAGLLPRPSAGGLFRIPRLRRPDDAPVYFTTGRLRI